LHCYIIVIIILLLYYVTTFHHSEITRNLFDLHVSRTCLKFGGSHGLERPVVAHVHHQ